MKNTIYIFSALLMLAACSKEIQEPNFEGEVLPEGTMVKTTFTVSYPKDFVVYAETRALEEKPDIENMYLALFGSTELQYWIPATLKGKPSDSEDYVAETKYVYEAMLPVTNSPLQIHFIGNVPAKYSGANAQIPQFSGSTQEKVMNEMISEDMKGGYWQKINVDYIKATKKGNVTMVDFGDGISLDDVPHVRNYAKISYEVPEESEDYHAEFKLLGYTLINVPKKAYIAPWQSGLRYDNYYRHIVGAEDFYNSLIDNGYTGYTPDLSIDATKTVEAQPERKENATSPVYMYERPLPDVNNQTAVIAKIQWKPKWDTTTMGPTDHPSEGYDTADYILPTDADGDTNPNFTNNVAGNTYYYKIPLTDEDDLAIPILRNIYYSFHLLSIIGPGSELYEEALKGPFFGNISSSMEAANLTDITDTKTRLVVNRTNFTYLAPNTANITVRYYPVAGSDSFVTNVYTTTPESTEPYVYLEVLSVSDSHGTKYESAIAKTTVDDKEVDDITSTDGTISVKTVAASTQGRIKRSKIRLTGVTQNKRKLYREITITVMPTQDLSSETTISSETVGGKKNVTVTIGLPDELSYDIFPLTFKIEAENNNLSTNDTKLPVSFGPSAFTTGKNSYYFVKTITWAEYCKIIDGEYHWITAFPCALFATDTQSVKVKVRNFTTDEEGTEKNDVYFNAKELTLQ